MIGSLALSGGLSYRGKLFPVSVIAEAARHGVAPPRDMERARHRPEVSNAPDFLRVLWRRKWLVLAPVILVPLVAVLLSLQSDDRYEASADLVLSRQNLAGSLVGIDDPTLGQPERVIETQAELARTPVVVERTLTAAGVSDLTVDDFLDNSSVTGRSDADLLAFSVRDRDDDRAEQLATAYAQQFLRYRRELSTTAIADARERVQEQLDELEATGQKRTIPYRDLSETAQQLLTLESLQGSDASVVRPATGADQVEPRPRRNGLLGLVVGLAIGIGLAFLAEAFDTRVRSENDIEEVLDVPLLARLPEPPRRFRRTSRLVTLGEPFGADAEPFRILRSNLDIANIETGARSVMFTSGVEGEGKSTVVANLAVTLARTGRRLVLVDLDLRRPSLGRFFDLDNRSGVADVILGGVELDDAVVPVTIGGVGWNGRGPSPAGQSAEPGTSFAFLPAGRAGSVPSNPGSLVGTQALRDVLSALEDRSELVLIDAPPLLPVGDAGALSTDVDAIVLVTHRNVIRRTTLAEVRRILDACPAAKLGFVLTGAEIDPQFGSGDYDRSGQRKPVS
jgi:polysaccharide biosynthesis transport protein